MNLLIDTNRYSDVAKGNRDAVEVIESARTISVPFVVLAELRFGFLKGNHALQNEGALDRFLRKYGVAVLFPDETTTRHFATLLLTLTR